MNHEAFIELRCIQGSSDKVYKLSLERYEKDSDNCGWVVNFAYGRYGKPLKTGTKTPRSMGYDAAEKLYGKLMMEKQRKGYVCTDTEAGAPDARFQVASKEQTYWLPQLLNEVDEDELVEVWERFTPHCYVQTKHDGERRGIIFSPDNIIPANRKGQVTTVEPQILEDLQHLFGARRWQGVLDTEDMGSHLVIFDYLAPDELNLLDFISRNEQVEALQDTAMACGGLTSLHFDVARHITNYAELKAFVAAARARGAEGVVIRDGRGIYNPGKPNSGGCALKLKFWNDCTVWVSKVHDTKRSIQMSMQDDDAQWIVVGNCTIPANYQMPVAGQLVDVKYLYAYRGGSIYQPQYKGVRGDLDIEATTLMQLKYKDEPV